MGSWTREDAIRMAWVEAEYDVREVGVAALKADMKFLLDELAAARRETDTLRAELADTGYCRRLCTPENEELLRETDTLGKAVEFYADPETWRGAGVAWYEGEGPGGGWGTFEDRGATARAALAAVSAGEASDAG